VITHLVLGKARADLSPAESHELGEALDAIAHVPGVLHLSWGQDFSGRGKGYTHGAVVQLPDRDALHAYLTDPEHRRVVDVLNRLMPERLVIDYETATSGIST
jgi:hypothetical protein